MAQVRVPKEETESVHAGELERELLLKAKTRECLRLQGYSEEYHRKAIVRKTREHRIKRHVDHYSIFRIFGTDLRN